MVQRDYNTNEHGKRVLMKSTVDLPRVFLKLKQKSTIFQFDNSDVELEVALRDPETYMTLFNNLEQVQAQRQVRDDLKRNAEEARGEVTFSLQHASLVILELMQSKGKWPL